MIGAALSLLCLVACAPEDRWVVSSGQLDGKPYIARFRETVPRQIDPGAYPTLVTLAWHYDDGASGLPANDVRSRMERLEVRRGRDTLSDSLATGAGTVRGARGARARGRAVADLRRALGG